MFEELENMVENLGYSFKNKNQPTEDTKIVEYEATESQYSVHNESQALISKCEFLESQNSSLVEENQKLKQQVEGQKREIKQLEVDLKSVSLGRVHSAIFQKSGTKSNKGHVKKIKRDFEKLLEQSKVDFERKEAELIENFAKKEEDLVTEIEELKSQIHLENIPRIQELESTQEQLYKDCKEISEDCENLKLENESLQKKIDEQKTEMDEIIDVKDEQIMKLQEVNDEYTKVRTTLEDKERQDQEHLQECFEELERVTPLYHLQLNVLNQQLYQTLEQRNTENDEMRDDIEKLKNGFEIYEKEKKRATKYKKELRVFKEKDKENQNINHEREEAILKIKNSFMNKVEQLKEEVEVMKQKQSSKSVSFRKLKKDYSKLKLKNKEEVRSGEEYRERIMNELAFAKNCTLSFERDLANIILETNQGGREENEEKVKLPNQNFNIYTYRT